MKCPQCDSKTVVKDTRELDDAKRRRHECPNCGRKFSTIEIIYDPISGKRPLQSLDEMRQEAIREGENQLMEAIQEVLEEKRNSMG